jgi:O-antigen/teichoic acid export membrane protein
MHVLPRIQRWAALALGGVAPVRAAERRYVRILRGALTGLASKGISAVVGVLSVPLTVRYLGPERYGVWVTISTVLAWVQFADLGLGSGLTNAVATALGQGKQDQIRRDISTTFWFLVGIALALGGAYTVAARWIDWQSLFKVRSASAEAEVSAAMAVAIALFLLRFPLSVVDRIYQAHQETATSNLFATVGSVASLVALLVVTRTQGGLVCLVVAFSGTQGLVSFASAGWLVRRRRYLLPSPARFSWARGRGLLAGGGLFFLVQLNSLLIFQSGVLIIAHYLGAAQVTPYAVAWRLFTYATLPASLVFPALWPAYAEALAIGDGAWVRRTLRVSLATTSSLTLLLTAFLVTFGRVIIRTWAGPAAVPSQALLYWMGVWTVCGTLGINFAALLNAAGRLVGQLSYGLANALANVVLAAIWARTHGINGVIAALSLSYLVFSLGPATFETLYFIRYKVRIRGVGTGPRATTDDALLTSGKSTP